MQDNLRSKQAKEDLFRQVEACLVKQPSATPYAIAKTLGVARQTAATYREAVLERWEQYDPLPLEKRRQNLLRSAAEVKRRGYEIADDPDRISEHLPALKLVLEADKTEAKLTGLEVLKVDVTGTVGVVEDHVAYMRRIRDEWLERHDEADRQAIMDAQLEARRFERERGDIERPLTPILATTVAERRAWDEMSSAEQDAAEKHRLAHVYEANPPVYEPLALRDIPHPRGHTTRESYEAEERQPRLPKYVGPPLSPVQAMYFEDAPLSLDRSSP